MKRNKRIGILGGSGSPATAKFFSDVIEIAQRKFKAEQFTDFPVVYLYNLPLEGFHFTGFLDIQLVKNQLISGLQQVESWGADFIVLPCNTLHYFITEMRAAISIPIISIIEVTINEVTAKNYSKVGILSSPITRDMELYKKPLENKEVATVIATDEEQSLLNEVVKVGINGTQGEKEKEIMLKIINRMQSDGAEAVILGCTELPLAIRQSDTDTPLLNSIQLLAENALYEVYQ